MKKNGFIVWELFLILHILFPIRFISQGSDFAKALSLCSVQFCGIVKSAVMPPLSPNLSSPQPPVVTDGSGSTKQMSVTIAAGKLNLNTDDVRK